MKQCEGATSVGTPRWRRASDRACLGWWSLGVELTMPFLSGAPAAAHQPWFNGNSAAVWNPAGRWGTYGLNLDGDPAHETVFEAWNRCAPGLGPAATPAA